MIHSHQFLISTLQKLLCRVWENHRGIKVYITSMGRTVDRFALNFFMKAHVILLYLSDVGLQMKT